jgi:hypothetical protein
MMMQFCISVSALEHKKGMSKHMINKTYGKFQKTAKISYIPSRENSEISNSITKNWTDQAIRCYLSNSNCLDCSVAKSNYSFVCQMSSVIQILLDQIGPPEKNKIDKMVS